MYLVVEDLILSLMNAGLLYFSYEIGVQVGISTSSCSILLDNPLQLWIVCMIFLGVEFSWRDLGIPQKHSCLSAILLNPQKHVRLRCFPQLHMLIIVLHSMHFTDLLDCLML